jgi:hypothetical protein
VSLVGCGGSDSTSSTPHSTKEATQSSSRAATQEQALRERVNEIQRLRQQKGAEPGERASAPESPSATNAPHHDSGGGAAQFRGQGDNSIQEFGSEASSSERERAASALHGYLDSHAAGRWTEACHNMSALLLVDLERMGAMSQSKPKPKGCAETLAVLSTGLPKPVAREGAEADVGSLRVNGDRALILYHGARGKNYAMPMLKEGGQWKVTALAGAPLAR